MTVGEIAAQLAPIAPDTEATIQQIRHWTREQMLLPVDFHHAGTGKHRRYDASAIYDAAILLMTTRAGLNIASVRYLVEALTLARFALRKWKKEGGPLYLHISRSAPTDRTEIAILRKEPPTPAADLTITIDLRKLWSRIKQA